MSFIVFLQQSKHYLFCFLIYIKAFFIRKFSKIKKCIFILATPRHGNLGDHAIVYSQYKLFDSVGCRKNVFEFNYTTYEICKNLIQKISKPEDLIIIDGGGNIGTLWFEEELLMREIVQRFHKNSVFIMPQTAFFEDSDFGKKALKDSVEVYCNHPDLTIFCRDKITYDLISEKFKSVKSFFVPDMVMYLSDISEKHERNGALICFREDLECVCSNEVKEKIFQYLESKNISISKSSTLIKRRVDFFQREKVLFDKWNEFSKAKFIITDRLHGMIFCAITATPCLAIDNVSHKVRDGYEWLKHLPYVLYCDNEEDIIKNLDRLTYISEKSHIYDNKTIMEYYEIIRQQIKSKL